MDRAYFRKYYDLERNHWWFKVRERILRNQLKSLLPANKELSILNIGSATGRSTEWLQTFGQVTSIEYDEETCEFCRSELHMDVLHASITDIPFAAERFDLVCAFDVIEHVEQDGLAVKEMGRVCKKDGLLFITVPALKSLWSAHDVINHHYRRYSRRSLKHLFSIPGLKLLRCSYFNSILFPIIFVYRNYQRTKGKHKNAVVKSDFEVNTTGHADKILEKIFAIEIPYLRRFNFPVGVSLLLACRKQCD